MVLMGRTDQEYNLLGRRILELNQLLRPYPLGPQAKLHEGEQGAHRQASAHDPKQHNPEQQQRGAQAHATSEGHKPIEVQRPTTQRRRALAKQTQALQARQAPLASLAEEEDSSPSPLLPSRLLPSLLLSFAPWRGWRHLCS